MIRDLRDDFADTPGYSKVGDKESLNNWDLMINTLLDWDVLLEPAAQAFRTLKDRRHAAIHFER